MHALTVSLAAELARYSVCVNTLAPGIIRTPPIDDAALFLARAGFVTGTTLDVDGGYSHAR